ncbi:hypothetical protein Bpfe_010565 [Biomphalaria pfeifferi]|uniref:Uncharacterized protein n=1 Tax=Biomphalaria pfeifferi TaxID=112525 RepID=A0AAD8BTZ7_BIOPF|nr:hypothetical protein Bpfe_010565 [Biomphalaria pfeifferi]
MHYLTADKSTATPDIKCIPQEEICDSTEDCCDPEDNECRLSNHPGGNISFCVSRKCTHIGHECKNRKECCKFKQLEVNCRMTNDEHKFKCLDINPIQLGIKPTNSASLDKVYEELERKKNFSLLVNSV